MRALRTEHYQRQQPSARSRQLPPVALRNIMMSCPLLPSSITGLTSQVRASSMSPDAFQVAPASREMSTAAAVVML